MAGRPVLSVLYRLTCQAGHLSRLACPGYIYPSCPIPDVLPRLPCHVCPAKVAPSEVTCLSYPVLAVIFWTSRPLIPALAVPS
jgi:hypothetical protein